MTSEILETLVVHPGQLGSQGACRSDVRIRASWDKDDLDNIDWERQVLRNLIEAAFRLAGKPLAALAHR